MKALTITLSGLGVFCFMEALTGAYWHWGTTIICAIVVMPMWSEVRKNSKYSKRDE